MCNRMWSFVPFVAFALQNRVRILVPFFGEYASDFPALGALPRIHFARTAHPFFLRVVRRLLRASRSIPPSMRSFLRLRISDDWGHEHWREDILVAPFSAVFLAGWTHPPPVADLRPWRDDLRVILRPGEALRRRGDELVAAARQRARNVVGIHLRRADYRTWAGGRYCYTNAQYAALMGRIRDLVDGPTVFLLCSNEPIAEADFVGFDVGRLPGASGLEDLHVLSLCDMIAGPPSTYSMWASFIGDVPLHIVESIEAPLAANQFSPVIALNRFADGRQFSLAKAAGDDLDAWFRAE